MPPLEGFTPPQVGDYIRRVLVPDVEFEIRRLMDVADSLSSVGNAGASATILQAEQGLALLKDNLLHTAWSLHGDSEC